MMKNKWLWGLSILSFIGTLGIYNLLPETIPTHWNIQGEVDRYSGRYMALILAALPVVLYYFMILIPKIDPRRDNYARHARAYSMIKQGTILFLILMVWLTNLYSLGWETDISKIVIIGVGVLFALIGNYLTQIKHNYFVGIRTPWTLASETVWKKTHRLGGILFVIFGIMMIASAFVSNVFSAVVIGFAVVVIVIGLFGYSYWLFRKIEG